MYLLNVRSIFAIVLVNWTQFVGGFSFLLQRYARKFNDVKKHSNSRIFFVIERNQLNAAHAQLLENLRPIAFAETRRFQTIQSLEFRDFAKK